MLASACCVGLFALLGPHDVEVLTASGQLLARAAVRGNDLYLGGIEPILPRTPAPQFAVAGSFTLCVSHLSGRDSPRVLYFNGSGWFICRNGLYMPTPLRWRLSDDDISLMAIDGIVEPGWSSSMSRSTIHSTPLLRVLNLAEDITGGKPKFDLRLPRYSSEPSEEQRPVFEMSPYEVRVRGVLRELPLRAHADFTMTGRTVCDLYIAENSELQVYRRVAKDLRDKSQWGLLGATPVPWTGPFQMFDDGIRQHFVTSGGRVYSWSHNWPDEPPSATWAGPPVLGVVTDADNGTSWAFTRDEYFSLRGMKYEPRKHTLGALPVDSPRGQFDAALKRGQLLRPGVRPQ